MYTYIYIRSVGVILIIIDLWRMESYSLVVQSKSRQLPSAIIVYTICIINLCALSADAHTPRLFCAHTTGEYIRRGRRE